jgi:hypothetical protein
MSGVKIPPSSATVSVSVIDSTASAYNIPAQNLFKPTIPGLDTLNFCSYAFLVTNENNGSKRSLVFDLGIRKDWRNLVPSMVEKLDSWKSEVLVEKDVADILVENGTDLGSIEAIIWR